MIIAAAATCADAERQSPRYYMPIFIFAIDATPIATPPCYGAALPLPYASAAYLLIATFTLMLLIRRAATLAAASMPLSSRR